MTEDELRAWRSSIRVGSRVAHGIGGTFWMGTVIDGPVLYDHWWARGTRRWTVDFDLPAEDGEPDVRLMPDYFRRY